MKRNYLAQEKDAVIVCRCIGYSFGTALLWFTRSDWHCPENGSRLKWNPGIKNIRLNTPVKSEQRNSQGIQSYRTSGNCPQCNAFFSLDSETMLNELASRNSEYLNRDFITVERGNLKIIPLPPEKVTHEISISWIPSKRGTQKLTLSPDHSERINFAQIVSLILAGGIFSAEHYPDWRTEGSEEEFVQWSHMMEPLLMKALIKRSEESEKIKTRFSKSVQCLKQLDEISITLEGGYYDHVGRRISEEMKRCRGKWQPDWDVMSFEEYMRKEISKIPDTTTLKFDFDN